MSIRLDRLTDTTRPPDFYLGSGEHRGEWSRVRACWIEERLQTEPGRPDYVWIVIDPPVEPDRGPTISRVVIGPHFSGQSISLGRFPIPVYIYVPMTAAATEVTTFDAGAFELSAWGELYADRTGAENAAKDRPAS